MIENYRPMIVERLKGDLQAAKDLSEQIENIRQDLIEVQVALDTMQTQLEVHLNVYFNE